VTTGAFLPVVDGRGLTFRAEGPRAFVDDQTGSTWDVLGRAVSGPLAGTQCEATGHLEPFWFAWAACHPETRQGRQLAGSTEAGQHLGAGQLGQRRPGQNELRPAQPAADDDEPHVQHGGV